MTEPPRTEPRPDGALSSGWRRIRAGLLGRRLATSLTVAAAAVVTIAAGTVIGARITTASPDRVPPGTSIAGIAVGGLTAAEAERAVIAGAPPPTVTRLALPGSSEVLLALPARTLGARPRARLAARRALRQQPLGRRVLHELGIGGHRDVSLDYRLDATVLRRTVRRVVRRVARRPRSAVVRVRDGTIVVTNARTGRRVLRGGLAASLRRLPARLVVPLRSVPPPIDLADAQAAAAHGRRIISRPVVVSGSGRRAVLSTSRLTRALRFPATGGEVRARLDGAIVASALRPTFGSLERSARSAGFRVRGRRVDVVPAAPGRGLDGPRIAAEIESRSIGDAVPVHLTAIAPRRSTAEAKTMRIRELVGGFTTPYACCEPRVSNIQRAAQILDGRVIAAGATFSLNEALGERTASRGFIAAPQINAGRLEDAVGGGVSQVATTVFNAAFFAGLRIVTHTPHEFWISRYPPGREATVSWGGPELVVQNDWPAAILLKVVATDTALTVRMYSSRLGRRVETETSGAGSAGSPFSVAYTREVWERDRLRRDERFTWTYTASPAD